MAVGGQRHTPAALPLERDLLLFLQEAVRALGPSRGVKKISPPSEFDPRTVQPVAVALPTHTQWYYIDTFLPLYM
jgi:hypothetical protein